MLLYKYRPWNEFAEQIIANKSIFYPSKKNLNDFAELIHPIKFETNSHDIFRIKTNQENGSAHRSALLFSLTISDILNRIENGQNDILNIDRYSKYLKIKDPYQRIVEATYDEMDNIHDAFFYFAINQFEDSKLLYCPEEVAISRINEKLNKIGILSLSSKSDCPVMWAQYAANHCGVVFIFDSSKDSLISLARGVEYIEERPEITLSSIPSIFYKKAKAWEYEHEYRILVKNGDGCYSFNPESLIGLILGIRIDTNTRNKILNIAASNNIGIDVYQARTSLSNFKIEVDKIS